jgi:dienelactone hydrolase
MRLPRSIVSALALLSGTALAQPAFHVNPKDALIDEPVAISISGLQPGIAVTVRAHSPHWSSRAMFTADAQGVVDLTRMAPARADYSGIDPMGLFWSTTPDESSRVTGPPEPDARMPEPEEWTLTAEINGVAVATEKVVRRAVAADVTMTIVHDNGLVGVFYQPAGATRHPAMIVVSGSGGGVPGPWSDAGGLASRGYAVLALAYFGVDHLPRSLHNIPLEYFGTALDWLRAQPSVDPDRIGLLGTSRGGELALLLGSIFSQIKTVIAIVPSDVVWGGCCDVRNESSWTIGGRPLVWATPGNSFRTERAAIQVERIHGAVLLISGKRDHIWDSSLMSERVMDRLHRNNFGYLYEHLSYENAGHGIGRPYTSTMEINRVVHPLTHRVIDLGGTPAGTAHAREDAWKHILAFLDAHLR